MRQHRRPRPAPGFSLLEAIVTMVIVSLIITLLMQALAQSLDLRSRLLRHQRHATVAGLQEQWFRDTVASAIADLPDGIGPMTGSDSEVEFVTVRPLGGGGLESVRWVLQPVPGGWALHYADATWPDLVVIAGPLRSAEFSYLDSADRWQSRWQPEAGEPDVLPRMVRLQATTAIGELQWLVPIATDPGLSPFLRPDDPASGI